MTRPVVAVVALGGALGSATRYVLGWLWPDGPGFPWTTFAVNVTGCLAIGLLAGVLARHPDAHPLLRPLLGTGFLGGFTTFSAYAVRANELVAAGRPATAAAYVLGTLLAALTAVRLGQLAVRR